MYRLGCGEESGPGFLNDLSLSIQSIHLRLDEEFAMDTDKLEGLAKLVKRLFKLKPALGDLKLTYWAPGSFFDSQQDVGGEEILLEEQALRPYVYFARRPAGLPKGKGSKRLACWNIAHAKTCGRSHLSMAGYRETGLEERGSEDPYLGPDGKQWEWSEEEIKLIKQCREQGGVGGCNSYLRPDWWPRI